MSTRSDLKQDPSPAELAVLKALWSGTEFSAREVHEQIAEDQDWSYSTTRTVLNRMVQKSLVRRRDSHGLTLFAAAEKKVALLNRMVRYFADRVLELDGRLPASAFTDSKLLDETEKEELRVLLEDDESGKDSS